MCFVGKQAIHNLQFFLIGRIKGGVREAVPTVNIYGSKLAAIFPRFTCFPSSFCFVQFSTLIGFTLKLLNLL